MQMECNPDFAIVLLDLGEIQIGRNAPSASDEDPAKAGAIFEGDPVQNAAFDHELWQVGEHDLFLGDHEIAQSGLG